MNEHVNPVMVEALRGHWPHIAPDTPPEEAQRLAADLYNTQHKAVLWYSTGEEHECTARS